MSMRHLICFGNELHGDDGFGPAVCRQLSAMHLPDNVRVFEAGTRGLDALGLFDDCDEAILVDAREPNGQPGKLTFPDRSEVAKDHHLPGHGAGLGYLLSALDSLGQSPKIRIVAAEAESVAPFQIGLSTSVALAVSQTVNLVQQWLDLEVVDE